MLTRSYPSITRRAFSSSSSRRRGQTLGDSLGSMSDPEEDEDRMPDDEDSLCLGVNLLTLASESGGGTEDDPVGPITTNASGQVISHSSERNRPHKAFLHARYRPILQLRRWCRRAGPKAHTRLAAQTCGPCVTIPKHREDQIVEQAKSGKCKKSRTEHVPFPSSTAEDTQDDMPLHGHDRSGP